MMVHVRNMSAIVFFLAFGAFIFVNSSYKSFCMDMKKYSGTRKT